MKRLDFFSLSQSGSILTAGGHDGNDDPTAADPCNLAGPGEKPKESGKKDKTETPARIAVIASLHIDHIWYYIFSMIT